MKIVYNVLSSGKKVVTYGEIIHNKDVVYDLEKKGIDMPNDIITCGELCDYLIERISKKV